MSAEVCPVCRGKGLVPNGFYVVGSSNLGNYQKTTSDTPETCRSCGGKGYLIGPEYIQASVYPESLVSNIVKSCSNCTNNDGNSKGYMVQNKDNVYGESKYRCLLSGKLYSANHHCKNFKCNQNSDK